MAANAGNKIRNAKLESTIGAAFFSQTLAVNDETVKFEIWDTAGQERYHSLAPMPLSPVQRNGFKNFKLKVTRVQWWLLLATKPIC
uniref:Uncharacterized protein n=1 Tax=Oryza rufipogon TaxID=4529 RepID=A0A0E0NZ84_ORYRU